MHILYEIEHLSTSGGIERMLTEKANYLADVVGWEVSVVVLLEEDGKEPFYALSDRIRCEYLHVQKGGISMCLLALWRLNMTVRRLHPDICVAVQTIGALSCLLNSHGLPTIYEAHGIRTCMQHPIAMSVAERFADAVVVLSDGNAQRYGNARKVVKIPNFSTLSTTLSPDYGSKHCVAVGRLDFEKDYVRMIRLWKSVCQRFPDWVLDIYGDGPERNMLQQLIEQEQLTRNVVLHGNVKHVAEALLSGSLLLLTSQYEGFGLVIVEAARCGIATVAFDCPDGPREIIRHNQTGLLIPYDDDLTMCDALCYLLRDTAQRKSMGIAAREDAKRFDKTAIMQVWKDLFENL